MCVRRLAFAVLVVGLGPVGPSCGRVESDPDCPVGSEGCPCGSDGTCDDGLECREDECVSAAGDSDTDTDTDVDTDVDTDTDTDTDTTSAPDMVVFVTSTTYVGNLGGVPTADDECQGRANEVGLDGQFMAWLSDDEYSAADRLDHSTGRYVLTDGTVVAENWDDLTDGSLAAPIGLDESGDEGPITDDACGTHAVWTGTNPSGMTAGDGFTCNDWTSNDTENGMLGQWDRTEGHWTFTCTIANCRSPAALYCFQQ